VKTYQETLAHLYRLARFGMRPGLGRISATLGALGNPQNRVRVVHVAGTNGKGSASAFLASVMAAGGYRTALFTSPHLIRFTERFRINGVELSEERATELADRVMAAAHPDATFFEIVTAMALLHFAEEKVDLAVLEAGMGGGSDATAIAPGILSVISPISLDHSQYLGETLAEIAREKGGIMKGGRPVVVAPQAPDVREVLRERGAESGCRIYWAGVDFDAVWEESGLDYRGIHAAVSGLRPGIPGRYQRVNSALALCAAELLAAAGFELDESLLRRGIESARWPGRMEMFGESPRYLLDGAHNAAGGEALAESVADLTYDRLILVAGIMGDKDAEQILAPLLPLARRVFAVSPGMERAMPSSQLALLCGRLWGGTVVDAGGVVSGLLQAAEIAGPSDLILVSGSLFTVGEARAFLVGEHFEPCRG